MNAVLIFSEDVGNAAHQLTDIQKLTYVIDDVIVMAPLALYVKNDLFVVAAFLA